MGVNLLSRKCHTYCDISTFNNVWDTKKIPEAPNPNVFRIRKMEQVKNNVVVLIHYPNCDNYEGNKICLYKNTILKQVLDQIYIDPHFSNDCGLSPFARFEPTEKGWEMAVKMGNIL